MNKNEIKYIVKPEDKVVIGIYRLEDPELFSELSNFTFLDRTLLKDIMIFSDRFENAFSVTIKAIAKCQGEDVFDEEFGKKLVEAKISKKRHQIILKHINIVLEDIFSLWCKLSEIQSKHRKKLLHINKDLSEYFGVKG